MRAEQARGYVSMPSEATAGRLLFRNDRLAAIFGTRRQSLLQLGIVALRTGHARKLLYDGGSMLVTNIPAANQHLQRECRADWEV